MTIEQREVGEESQKPEIIIIPKQMKEENRQELLKELEEITDPEEKRLMSSFVNHAIRLTEIPKVRGVLVRQHQDDQYPRVNLLTVFDELVIGDEDTSNAFDGARRVNAELASKLREFGMDFGGSTGQCGDDFDGWLLRRLTREQNERDGIVSPSSGNEFRDLMRSFDEGYTTIAVLKIE